VEKLPDNSPAVLGCWYPSRIPNKSFHSVVVSLFRNIITDSFNRNFFPKKPTIILSASHNEEKILSVLCIGMKSTTNLIFIQELDSKYQEHFRDYSHIMERGYLPVRSDKHRKILSRQYRKLYWHRSKSKKEKN
jgi:hypothetical protein